MRRWIVALLSTLTIALSVNAYGHGKSGPVKGYVRGTGELSCGQFEGYRNNTIEMDLVTQWVWGYLVAYNSRGFFDLTVGHAVSQVALPDQETVVLFIDQFCKKNPLSSVQNAAIALLKGLGGAVVWRPAPDNP